MLIDTSDDRNMSGSTAVQCTCMEHDDEYCDTVESDHKEAVDLPPRDVDEARWLLLVGGTRCE